MLFPSDSCFFHPVAFVIFFPFQLMFLQREISNAHVGNRASIHVLFLFIYFFYSFYMVWIFILQFNDLIFILKLYLLGLDFEFTI